MAKGVLNISSDMAKALAKAAGIDEKTLSAALKAVGAAKAAASGNTSGKTSSSKTSSGTSVKLTAAENKLVELYRAADADTRKAAVKLLKGEDDQPAAGKILNTIIGSAVSSVLKK